MALQDLTPQLRTRLSRMERMVGWFIFLATALLLFGFGYYIYHTAENKGWFKIKAEFHTFVQSSAGLNAGDKVYMMGFPVGNITEVHAMPPGDQHNVRVKFEVVDPYFRYIRVGAVVKVNAGLLSQRQLEITRVNQGYAICVTQPVLVFTNLDDLHQKIISAPGEWQLSQDVFDANTNLLFTAYTTLTESNLEAIAALKPESIYAYNNTEHDRRSIVASWHPRTHRYENFTPNSDDAWLKTVEAPPVSDQLQAMVTQVQNALPGILALTNKISAILNNAADATSNLNVVIASARPMVTNFADVSSQLREPGGVLAWAMGTNGDQQLQFALTNLNSLLVHTDTNLDALVTGVGQTLDNVAGITGSLRTQVEQNSNILWSVSKMVIDSDDLVQGLKRHWLLRSAFKKENAEMKKADEAAKKAAGQK